MRNPIQNNKALLRIRINLFESGGSSNNLGNYDPDPTFICHNFVMTIFYTNLRSVPDPTKQVESLTQIRFRSN